MSIEEQLFEGRTVRLAPPDPLRDAEIESRWTHDPGYGWLVAADPIRPLSPGQIRQKYEAADKAGDKEFLFAIRTQSDDRLVGFTQLNHIVWNHGNGRLSLGIGEAADRGHGYGAEALRLILRFAFGELNLHRVAVVTFEYNDRGVKFLERRGFLVEVRQRQAIARFGRRWDTVWLGLLRGEWAANREMGSRA